MQSRRDRVRQAAIDEIKSIAWEIANEQGIDDVTVNGIARRMGMTPPAFYSYFKSRDDLIMALVIEAYQSYRKALEDARDSVPDSDSAGRLYCVFIAYREWAIANPNLFGLFAGRHVQGFATEDPRVLAEAEAVYQVFAELYNKAWQQGAINVVQRPQGFPAAYADQLKAVIAKRDLQAPLEVVNLALNASSLVHGMISMELSGRLSHLVGDAFQYYRFQILDLLLKLGIDYTPDTDS